MLLHQVDLHGQQCWVHDVLGSTMDEAHRLAKLGTYGLIVAQRQTEGRGTRGRRWCSELGGLYMSMSRPYILDSEVDLHIVEAASISVVTTLERIGLPGCTIKLPNDVVKDGRKIAGILEEPAPWGRILGIGVNLNNPPPVVDQPTTSLVHEIGQTTDIDYFLAELYGVIARMYEEFPSNLRRLQATWKRLSRQRGAEAVSADDESR